MTTKAGSTKLRERGNIRRMRDRFQVRISAGEDPSTGERIILVKSVMIEKPGNERSERNYVVPNVGDVPLVLFVREAAARLEKLYARLRKCRAICSGKPFIEKHAEKGEHDCAAVECKPPVCKPYAASSVRSIHAILSGACTAAVR